MSENNEVELVVPDVVINDVVVPDVVINDVVINDVVVNDVVVNDVVVNEAVKPELHIQTELTDIDINKTILQLLVDLLSQNDDKLNNMNIHVTPEMRGYLLVVCKEYPDFFATVESTLKNIISDNKIDTKDIPEILILISKLYVIIRQHKHEINKLEPNTVVKTLLHILFVLYIQNHNIENDTLATAVVKIIEVSLDLIQLKLVEPPKIGCFKNLFKK
jgi:hypothetical protein